MTCQSSLLTIVRHVWDLEAFPAVPLVGPELNPEPFGTGGEGDGTFVSLTRLVGGHGVGKSCNRRTFMYAGGGRGCSKTETGSSGSCRSSAVKYKKLTH